MQRFYKFLTFSPYSRMSLYMLAKHGAVFFADSNNLNDPLECKSIIDVNFKEEDILNIIEENRIRLLNDSEIEILYNRQYLDSFEDYKKKLNAPKGSLTILGEPVRPQNLFEDLAHAIVGRAKVFSMSENDSSPHLWAHYADSHKGFCLEFEYDRSVKSKFLIEKIVYSEEIPTISAVDIFRYYNSSRKSIILTRKLYSTKSKHWNFESEYRMLHLSIKNPPDTIFSIPEGIYVKNENLKLKSVNFGMKSDKYNRNTVTDIFKQYDIKDIEFYKSTGFDNNYNVLKQVHSVK